MLVANDRRALRNRLEMRGTVIVADASGSVTDPAADPSVAAATSVPAGSPEPLADASAGAPSTAPA